jgi:ATP-binding cassette subfamily F protein 3
VLIISHDRHLIDATCDTLWIAADGTVKPFEDDLDAYQRMLLSSSNSRGGGAGSKEGRKKDRKASAARREELAPLRKSIKEAEDAIELLKKKRRSIERQLGDPALYNGEPEKIIALGKDKAKLDGQISEGEEIWLELTTKLETAEADTA